MTRTKLPTLQALRAEAERALNNENYHDREGKPISLERLCREDPAWAAARLRRLMESEAMAREARQQAGELEAVLFYFEEPIELGEARPLHHRHHKPRTAIRDAIAFLRDLGGLHK